MRCNAAEEVQLTAGAAHHCYLHGWPGRAGEIPAPPAGTPAAAPDAATPAASSPPLTRAAPQAPPTAPGLGWDLGAGRAAAAAAASAAAATASASAAVTGLWRRAEPEQAPCIASPSKSGFGRRSGGFTGTADAAVDPGSDTAAALEDPPLPRPEPLALGEAMQGAGHGGAGPPAGAGGSGGVAHAAAASAVKPGSASTGRSGQMAPAVSGAAVLCADAGHMRSARTQGDTPAAPADPGSGAQAGTAAGGPEPEQRGDASGSACARVTEVPGPLAAKGAGMHAAGSAELPVSTVPLG